MPEAAAAAVWRVCAEHHRRRRKPPSPPWRSPPWPARRTAFRTSEAASNWTLMVIVNLPGGRDHVQQVRRRRRRSGFGSAGRRAGLGWLLGKCDSGPAEHPGSLLVAESDPAPRCGRKPGTRHRKIRNHVFFFLSKNVIRIFPIWYLHYTQKKKTIIQSFIHIIYNSGI